MKKFSTVVGDKISVASHFLQQGEAVGIPTETVYGLAANALNDDAVLKIFSAKNRPHFDPLIVHTYHVNEIHKYVNDIPALAQGLIESFMPGPLTLLLKKKELIPDLVTSGLEKVAIRIPSHPIALQLLQQLDFPLAAPSANPFGYISPTTAQHVYDQLQGEIPYILDGGMADVGVESTIVGFENDEVIVYRLGGITIEEIERVVKRKVRLEINSSSNPSAPGSLKSHYAPTKNLIIGEFDDLIIGKQNTGVIAFNKYINGIAEENQILLSETGNLNEAAKNLFAAMRKLDSSNVDEIIAVKFPDEGLGKAINDRLKRAST